MKHLLGEFYTVGELKRLLNKVPNDYLIEPFGDPSTIVWYDDEEERCYMDNEDGWSYLSHQN